MVILDFCLSFQVFVYSVNSPYATQCLENNTLCKNSWILIFRPKISFQVFSDMLHLIQFKNELNNYYLACEIWIQKDFEMRA